MSLLLIAYLRKNKKYTNDFFINSLGYKIAPINVPMDEKNTRNPTMIGRKMPLRSIPLSYEESTKEIYKCLINFYKASGKEALNEAKSFETLNGLTKNTLIPSSMVKISFINLNPVDETGVNDDFFMKGSCASLAIANYHKLKSAGYENVKILAYKENYSRYHVGILIDDKDFYDFNGKKSIKSAQQDSYYGKATITSYKDFMENNFKDYAKKGDKYYDTLEPLDEFLLEYHSSNLLYNHGLIKKDNYVEISEKIPEHKYPDDTSIISSQPNCFDYDRYDDDRYFS